MWFAEELYPDLKLQLKGDLILKKKTPFQKMELYKSPLFGETLVLDKAVQTTVKDEFIYHEMLTHTVMTLHPRPERILIIGGGDGGILREVLKYKTVKEVVLAEIDSEVIALAKKHLKKICKNSFSDRRTKILVQDGAEIVKTAEKKFDIVIVDSPDPIGAAKVLFSKPFYKDIFSALKDDGLMIRQSGSTILQGKELKNSFKLLTEIFPFTWVHLVAIPTYIGGFFSLLVASKKVDLFEVDLEDLENKFNKLKLNTSYYNPHIHLASAVLPEYVKKMLS